MILLPRRQRWYTQPSMPVGIDGVGELASGVVIAWNGACPSIELVSRQLSSLAGSGGLSFVGTSYGQSLSLGTAYLTFPNRGSYNITGELTVAAIATPTAVSSDTSIIAKTTANGARDSPFDFGGNSTKIRLGRANAGGYKVWGSGSSWLSANTPCIISVSQSSDISSNPTFYCNGVKDTVAPVNLYSGGGTGAATANSTVLRVGNRDDGATLFSGYIGGIYIWNRILTDNEHADLASAFWQPYSA